MPFIIQLYEMLSPKKVKTLFLKTRAKSTISDSLICLVIVSDCHNHFPLRDNRLAMSMVKEATSLLFVNTLKTEVEYWGFETSLLRRINVSRISKVLHQREREREGGLVM